MVYLLLTIPCPIAHGKLQYDAFFDPEKGVVVYGDVITGYYGDILGKLNEGLLDESLREYFEHYYDMLLGDDKLKEE